jgi:hypothetical protein
LQVKSGATALGLDWSDIAAVLALSLFCKPITLRISQAASQQRDALIVDLVSSFKKHPDMTKLLESGKLAIIKEQLDLPYAKNYW